MSRPVPVLLTPDILLRGPDCSWMALPIVFVVEPHSERATLVSQIVQDSMDFWLPANNLGITTLNDGVIGALGQVDSVVQLHATSTLHCD